VLRHVLEFALAAGLLTLIPGPDTLLTLRTALTQGRAQAVAAAAGICTALAGWGCAAALGLTAALTASPVLYASLRWAGAAYLAYLGIRSLIAGTGWGVAEPAGPAEVTSHADATRRHRRQLRGAYLRGVVTNASNPKVGIFYLSLFPLFIPPGTAAGPAVFGYGLLLTAIHVTGSISWLTLIAVLAGRIGGLLRRRPVRRWADRAAGAAFLAFAARLAAGG
jgi:threonine/homoserine/homoserine lactone efflux protein